MLVKNIPYSFIDIRILFFILLLTIIVFSFLFLMTGINQYRSPDWIENRGDPWGRSKKFNPNAFDPAAPYVPKGETYSFSTNPEKPIENPFYLNNLRFFDPEKVKRFAMRLEGLAADIEDKADGRKIVAMIGTGGTIAMTEEDGELVPKLNPDYLMEYAGGGLNKRFAIAALEFPTPIDSSQMEIDYEADLVIVKSWLWANASEMMRKYFVGFLVTHGTDTLSGGGAYASMMLGPNLPFSVGFLGAQKTTEDRYSDVGINVKNALESLLVLNEAETPVCFTYMGGSEGGAYLPTGTIKVSDSAVLAMESPMHPRIIDASNFAVSGVTSQFQQDVHKMREGEDPKFCPIIMRGYSPTIPITPEIGTNPRHIYDMVKTIRDSIAVIVTSFGSFTMNQKIIEAVRQSTQETGKLFLAANPFPQGRTDHQYGPAHRLRESGAIPVQTMPIAVKAKTMLAQYIYGNDTDKIAAFIAGNNWVGEQSPDWSQPKEFAGQMVSHGIPAEV